MLAYTDIGKSDKTIVFLHGLGSHRGAWKPQHVLSEHFRLIIPDLRGHGETKEEEDISMKTYASDVISLLIGLKIDSAYICGMSLGGLVALEMYKQAPNMINGLILSNTTAYINSYLANSIIDKAKTYMDKRDELVVSVATRNLHNQKFLPEALDSFLIRDCYIECAEAPVGKNYFATLMSIRKPILIISGLYDRVVPSINQYAMWCANSFARFEFINAGHLSNVEARNSFNTLILDFMQ